MDLAYYGDIAHLIATGFLPLALFAIERAARTGRTGYCLGAIFLSAVTVLSNQFGITSLSLCALAVLTSLDKSEVRKAAIRVALIGAATYLCVCRILTPTLLALISKNAQLLGGDYRFTKLTLVGWAVMLAGGAVIRFGTARAPFAVRFAALLAWIFTGTLAIFYVLHIPILPVTQRYHLEADVSLSILIAVLIWQLPVRLRQVVLAIALMAAIPQTIWTRRLDRPLLKAADIEKTVEYQGSRWIGQNLPGVRTMVGGDATFWFDYFTENPQLSGGHDGLAPNFMQRIAVYAIYTGENAGDRDAQYSIFWMKAFGTSAIYVAGPAGARTESILSRALENSRASCPNSGRSVTLLSMPCPPARVARARGPGQKPSSCGSRRTVSTLPRRSPMFERLTMNRSRKPLSSGCPQTGAELTPCSLPARLCLFK